MQSNWFEVDRKGLARIIKRRGPAFILLELVQNAWDEEGVTNVNVQLTYASNSKGGKALITVADDSPNGFRCLSDGWTLFAESYKAGNAEQRGRFNLGEKLVFALADSGSIHTTSGRVTFSKTGRHVDSRDRRAKGSLVEIIVPMTAKDFNVMRTAAERVIPPKGIKTVLGETVLPWREPKETFTVTLPTELSEDNGPIRWTERQTEVRLYPRADSGAWLYEMGIPIVELEGFEHDVEVMQKVPLTMDRANLLPSFLRRLNSAVLSRTVHDLAPDTLNKPWVAEAIEDPKLDAEVVGSYVAGRFGDRVVSYDMSDPESNKRAVAAGYTVVTGSMLSKAAWANVRAAEAIKPAGQVTPSPKAMSVSPEGKPLQFIPRSNWTPGMVLVTEYAQKVAKVTLNVTLKVDFTIDPTHIAAASYAKGRHLIFSKLRLGAQFFERGVTESVLALIIHELGHELSGDHLSEEYYDALCLIGSRWALHNHQPAKNDL